MQIGYARVSTVDQNLQRQISQLEQVGCQKIFSEKKSGVANERSELEAMLAILREGDTVIVTELSRLGRSLTHTLKLIEDFKKRKIHFKSLDLGVDTTTPAGELVMNVFAALAQFERQSILERVKAGIEEARRKGKHMGRPKKGYDKDKVEKIIKLTNRNFSTTEIAKILDCSRRTIGRYKEFIKNMPALPPDRKMLQQNIFGKVDLL